MLKTNFLPIILLILVPVLGIVSIISFQLNAEAKPVSVNCGGGIIAGDELANRNVETVLHVFENSKPPEGSIIGGVVYSDADATVPSDGKVVIPRRWIMSNKCKVRRFSLSNSFTNEPYRLYNGRPVPQEVLKNTIIYKYDGTKADFYTLSNMSPDRIKGFSGATLYTKIGRKYLKIGIFMGISNQSKAVLLATHDNRVVVIRPDGKVEDLTNQKLDLKF